ncbi:MAG: DUF4340 domain-containing protein [Mariprofundales bacterium]
MRYIGIGLVITLAIALTWQQQSQNTQHQQDRQSLALIAEWPQFSAKMVRTLVIHHGDTVISLHRRGAQWMITDRYSEVEANHDLINRLLDDASTMQPQLLVTKNPDYFSRFRLAANADRLTLKGEEGAPLLDLLVGKPGTDMISTTVRRVGNDRVLTVNRSLGWQLGRSIDSWQAEPARQPPSNNEQ